MSVSVSVSQSPPGGSDAFHAIIPAGGSGTRLWPLSRAERPKFLLPLPGPRTMLQETVQRLLPLCAAEQMTIITGASHAPEVLRQLPELGESSVLIEPMPRGSGPAIGLGTLLAGRHDPQMIVGSFAADHVVTDRARFETAVRAAIATARDGHLVTIGIQPTHAETGYGYIRAGAALPPQEGLPIFQVDEFKEKPNLETATAYVESGNYQWNASMFVWRADRLREELHRQLPAVAEKLDMIVAAWDTPQRDAVLAEIWPTIEDITIDHGIMEHAQNVAVVPTAFGWTDLGDWHGLGALLASEPDEVVRLHSDVLTYNSARSVVYGRERLIALVGVEDLIVVDTPDALLVCHRSQAQQVRTIVDALKDRGSTDLI